MDDLDSKEDTNGAKSLGAGSENQLSMSKKSKNEPDILITKLSEELMRKKKTEPDILISKPSEEQMRKKNISPST